MKSSLCVLFALALSACGAPQAPTGELQLDQLRGQWVVINYWAQWCKPCIKEVPELNRLNSDYAGVTVLGVNYDGASGDDLASQVAQLGIDFTTLAVDPSGQLGIARPVVLPTTLILDPNGQLQETLIGPQTLASLARATSQDAGPNNHE